MPDASERDPDLAIVLTTAPDSDAAERIVHSLVEDRLVACGTLLPGVLSIYRWEGKVNREPELLVVLKTRRPLVERVFERIIQIHPYDVPELVAIPVEAASNAYGRWLRRETIEVIA